MNHKFEIAIIERLPDDHGNQFDVVVRDGQTDPGGTKVLATSTTSAGAYHYAQEVARITGQFVNWYKEIVTLQYMDPASYLATLDTTE